ncbi:MAG TPA: sugar phosphate isomerase/epimerase family protein [Terriglobales bacterium]|nr:sugar phosphate isomerase/epimerase family protein [Terriglobales bacterium]
MAAAYLLPPSALARSSGPDLHFPLQARERIAIASYPFREFIAGDGHKSGNPTIELKDFAAHVMAKFNINKIEPWTGHFPSTDAKYLEQFRVAMADARGAIVNIAVDGEHSPYAADRGERELAIAFSKKWVDAASALGSPCLRTNIPTAKDSKPDLERTADTLARVAEYASKKNVVVNLENDNPVSEEPFFLVKVIEKVNSPWLHALPDFANTLTRYDEKHAYDGVNAMFAHAYCISHVKDSEADEHGKQVRVDMAKTFGFMKQHGYKGYCSMEWDRPGDPYQGTAGLIQTTLQYLS